MSIRTIRLNDPANRSWQKNPGVSRYREDLRRGAETATLPALSTLERILPHDARIAEDILRQSYQYLRQIGFRFEQLRGQRVLRLEGEMLFIEAGEAYSDAESTVYAQQQFYGNWNRQLSGKYKVLWEMWNNAPVGYQTLRTDGTIITANQTLAKMLGYEVEEMRGQSIFDFILPKQRDEAKQRFLAKLAGIPVPPSMGRIYVCRDGRCKYLSATDSFVRDVEGNIAAVKTALIDVTELRRVQDRLFARKRSQPLAEGLSDQLRNLLGGISGAAQLLERYINLPPEKQKPAKAAEWLKTIQEGSASISNAVDSIIDWSGIRGGDMGSIDPRTIVMHILSTQLPPDIKLKVFNNANATFEGNSDQIYRTVNNLVLHAVSALNGSGNILVELRTPETILERVTRLGHPLRPGKYLVISVAYSAEDIDEGNISQLFYPYAPSRARKPTTENVKFGLSSIQGVVVDAYGGAIDVESIPGEGSKIILYFPTTQPKPE